MEHRLLIDPVALGRENVLETYLGLARAVPESSFQLKDNCILTSGPKELSFCNFAAGFGWTEAPSKRLEWVVETGRKNPGFWVFSLDGDEPSRIDSQLQASGFTLRQNLTQMICDRWSQEELVADDIFEAKNYTERLELCKFAARTFFTRTQVVSQEKIAEATALSDHRLFGVWDDHGPVAAMMVSESHGAVGIYNLCVRPELRHRGIGRSLVLTAAGIGQSIQKPVVLQCDPQLVEWYANLCFRPFGSVHAYTFSSKAWRDIL